MNRDLLDLRAMFVMSIVPCDCCVSQVFNLSSAVGAAVAGTEVAVKVRHPEVVKSVRRDFALMLRLAQVASLLPGLHGLHLEETLAQFAAPLQEQVSSAWHHRWKPPTFFIAPFAGTHAIILLV